MSQTEREKKPANRQQKEAARLAANASWNCGDVSRETRQQVRQEGRELEKSIARRARRAARELRQDNRPRRGPSAEAAMKAARESLGWFRRHVNPNRGFKKSRRAG